MNNRYTLIPMVGIICYFHMAVFSGEALFPEIKNWQLKVDDVIYTPDNLYELIDGAADAYIAYHFEDLHIGEYTNDKEEMIRVEIYRHSNPDNAFGIYASERMPDYNFLAIGTEGYLSYGVLNFFTGSYYIKLTWNGDEDSGDQLLIKFATLIGKQLNQANEWPLILSWFPENDRMPESERYTPENFMGYSFFQAAFSAGYKIDDTEFRLFIMDNHNSEDADTIVEKYLKSVKPDTTGKDTECYIVEDPFNGKMGIGKKGPYIFGVYNLNSDSLIKKYIEQLSENVKN